MLTISAEQDGSSGELNEAHRTDLDRRISYPAVFHIGDALDAFDTVLTLADAPGWIAFGHGPWVVDAHPPSMAEMVGWLARLA